MRSAHALTLVVLLGCQGDPVGEAEPDAGTGGVPGTGGVAGGSGTAGSGGGSGGGSGAGASGGAGGTATGGGGGVLVPGPDAAQGLDVDDNKVYFGVGKDLFSASKTDGTPSIVTSGVIGVREVVVAGGFAYFLDGDKTIRRAPATGGAAFMLVQGAGSFERYGDIATDGSYVYFTTTVDQSSYAGSVLRVPVGGGAPTEIHKVISAGQPHGIALFGGDVYWTQHLSGSIYKAPVGGGGATLLASGLAKPWKLGVSSNLLYWTETDGSLAYKKFGGSDVVVPASGPGDDVVLDDKTVYFSAPSAGKVYAALLDSTAAVVVAECTLPGALALDATSLYVACNGAPGAVLKVAK